MKRETPSHGQGQPAKMNKKRLARLINTLTEGDSLSREKAQGALIEAQDAAVLAGVAPLLKAKETATRMMTLEILKAAGNCNIDAIIALLDDENEDVRV